MTRDEAKQKIVDILYFMEDEITSYQGYDFPSTVNLPGYTVSSDVLEKVAANILRGIEEFISG